MEGLLARRGAPPTGQGAAPMPAQGRDPREQAQRSGIMLAAGRAMYDKSGLEKTIGMLGSGGDPVENAARGTAYLMHAIASSLRAKGKAISDDALLDAGRETLKRMLALAVESGLVPQDKAIQDMGRAEEIALSTFEGLEQGGTQDGRAA